MFLNQKHSLKAIPQISHNSEKLALQNCNRGESATNYINLSTQDGFQPVPFRGLSLYFEL